MYSAQPVPDPQPRVVTVILLISTSTRNISVIRWATLHIFLAVEHFSSTGLRHESVGSSGFLFSLSRSIF